MRGREPAAPVPRPRRQVAAQTAVNAIEEKKSVKAMLSTVHVSDGVTAGLDFRQQDALTALIVLRLTPTGFLPFE